MLLKNGSLICNLPYVPIKSITPIKLMGVKVLTILIFPKDFFNFLGSGL